MRRDVAIFGAGQAGFMVAQWLPSSYRVSAYIDNKEALWGAAIGGVPVISLQEALTKDLAAIVISIINREGAKSVMKQVEESGFAGQVIDAVALRELQDIRLAALRLCASDVRERAVPGCVAELGVYRGEFASEINRAFPDRTLYLFDTFSGFPQADVVKEGQLTGQQRFPDFSGTCVEEVRKALPLPDKAVFVEGRFPDSLENMPDERYAFVSIDPDLHEPTAEGLKYFWPRLSIGGKIFVHDYTSVQFPGVRKAVDAFCESNNLFVMPLMDLHGTAVLVKQGE